MPDEIDLLLSDEYVEFSAKIAEIHTRKKKALDEFNKKYEEFKLQQQSFKAEAKQCQTEWEEAKNKKTS